MVRFGFAIFSVVNLQELKEAFHDKFVHCNSAGIFEMEFFLVGTDCDKAFSDFVLKTAPVTAFLNSFHDIHVPPDMFHSYFSFICPSEKLDITIKWGKSNPACCLISGLGHKVFCLFPNK